MSCSFFDIDLNLQEPLFKIMSDTITAPPSLTAKDFATDQEVRCFPGCGDYSILAQVQKVMPTLGIARENIVIIKPR